MSRQLRKVLLELRDQRLLQAYQQGRTSIADDLVSPGNREGEPLRARLLQEACTRILADAGMRKFRFHDLRHTFGSLLIEEGAPLPYVRDQMGHSRSRSRRTSTSIWSRSAMFVSSIGLISRQVHNHPQPRRNPTRTALFNMRRYHSGKYLITKVGAKGGTRTPTPCGTRS